MRNQLPAIAVGAVLALLAILAILWLAPVAATDADRADALAAELRCPDCQGLSVADSQTASAREIRRQVDELVASGATDDDVRAHFVDRYGEWILLSPTSPAAWILPFAALALGVALLAAWLVRWRSSASPSNVALDDETRRRLHEEAETLDA
jgi:cytochrome c-type biogenesis protein CcmH